MPKQLIVKGHTLPFEGKTPGQWSGTDYRPAGKTKCSCGEESPELPNTVARQRWHRDHKLDVQTKAWWKANMETPCVCGDVLDEHDRGGQCTVEGCACLCFEEGDGEG